MSAMEVNFDGLIGPSHNYGGLSDGNLASAEHAGAISNPRAAALQGLEKMRWLVRAGLVHGVLPPLPRPNFDLLASAGFSGTDGQMIEQAARQAPQLLKAAFSASAMWAANAATVSPSADTADGRLHLTVANLSTMLHRSIEAPDTTATLNALFPDPDRFAVHAALPGHADFADEGAANHVRLASDHGAQGVELFVHGREAGERVHAQRYPARQSRLASESIARAHGLAPERTVHVRQAVAAIEAGAFHNDVVCVGTRDCLFTHAQAFADLHATLDALRRAADGAFELQPVIVPKADVSLEDARKSYLFNSQLLVLPGEERLVLLAPEEVRENAATRAWCEAMVAGDGPIGRVAHVDVRQSMQNGGGPACLRLRVVLTEDERAAVHPQALLDEAAIDRLASVVARTYRDRLSPADLADPAFAEECQAAREAILEELALTHLV